jgi:hypothetical protein
VLRDPVKRAASAHRHNLRMSRPPDGPQSLLKAFEDNPMLVIGSRYADQIERYFEVFRPERFLFLDFRRLTKDTAAVLDEVCDFLGLSPVGSRWRTRPCQALGLSCDLGGACPAPGHGYGAGPCAGGEVHRARGPQDAAHRSGDQSAQRGRRFTMSARRQVFAEDLARVEALTGLRI